MCPWHWAPASFTITPEVFHTWLRVPAHSSTRVSFARESYALTRSARAGSAFKNLAMPPTISPLSSTRNQ